MTNTAMRFNNGKPQLGYIPIRILQWSWCNKPTQDRGRIGSFAHTEALAKYALMTLRTWQTDAGIGWSERKRDAVLLRFWKDIHASELRQAAAVLAFGAEKYESWNWTKGLTTSALLDSTLRHIESVLVDYEVLDQESGLSQVGHILCNMIFLTEFSCTEFDDVPMLRAS